MIDSTRLLIYIQEYAKNHPNPYIKHFSQYLLEKCEKKVAPLIEKANIAALKIYKNVNHLNNEDPNTLTIESKDEIFESDPFFIDKIWDEESHAWITISIKDPNDSKCPHPKPLRSKKASKNH